jgi:AcrR family transcriptional regulator
VSSRGAADQAEGKVADPSPRISGEERRLNILESALVSFSRKSYDGVSLQEIADSVGILKGSVYYYYRSKEDLLFDVLRQIRREYDDKVAGPASRPGEPEARLRRLIEGKAVFLCENAARAGVLLCETGALSGERRAEIQADAKREERSVRAILAEMRDAGRIPAETDPLLAARWIIGMVNWTYRWYRSGGPLSPPGIAAATADFVMRALRDPGRRGRAMSETAALSAFAQPQPPARKAQAAGADAPRRRRKPEERRAEILVAAARIFHTRGYDSASLQDIADEVGIKKASIYHYFASKEDALNALLTKTAARGLEEVDRIGEEAQDPLAMLWMLVAAHVLRLCRNQMESQFFLQAYRRTPPDARRRLLADDFRYREMFTRTIGAGQAAGVFRGDIDAGLASILILGAANWTTDWLGEDADGPDHESIAREFAALSVAALAA